MMGQRSRPEQRGTTRRAEERAFGAKHNVREKRDTVGPLEVEKLQARVETVEGELLATEQELTQLRRGAAVNARILQDQVEKP